MKVKKNSISKHKFNETDNNCNDECTGFNHSNDKFDSMIRKLDLMIAELQRIGSVLNENKMTLGRFEMLYNKMFKSEGEKVRHRALRLKI